MHSAPGGQLAAVQEPERITLITVPRCEPYGVIEATSETHVGWLGNLLFLLKGTRARIVDPRKPAMLAEAQLLDGLRLLATMDEHALLASDSALVLVDATLRMRTLRTKTVPTVGGACPIGFITVDGDSLREWDAGSSLPKRTWKVSGTVFAVGGTSNAVWRITRERPNIVEVTALISRGQPAQHELPEPIVRATGHVKSDVVACLGESGRTYVVTLAGGPVRMVDTGPADRIDDISLLVGFETYVVIGQQQTPTQCAPLAPATWRSEIIAWTRSGITESFPLVPAIKRLAEQLELEDELVPAITLCYGAHLVGSRGVPPEDLDELLGGRWPDEVSGNGFLAQTGVLIFDGWVKLAPSICKALDEI